MATLFWVVVSVGEDCTVNTVRLSRESHTQVLFALREQDQLVWMLVRLVRKQNGNFL